jgi:hypothetical protein
MLNIRSNTWIRATLPEGTFSDPYLDPWSAGAAEMVFALPGTEPTERPTPMLLAPKFEEPPYNDLFRFVVDVDEEGLNVRSEPDSASESRALVYSGDVLQLAGDPGATTIVRRDPHTWVRVYTADGVQGWVNSYWLAWAD